MDIYNEVLHGIKRLSILQYSIAPLLQELLCGLIAISAYFIMLPGIRIFLTAVAGWGLKAGDTQSMKCAAL